MRTLPIARHHHHHHAPRDGWSSDCSIKPKWKGRPPAVPAGFFIVARMNLDFQKSDGLVTAVIQDHAYRPRPHGRLHERGGLPHDRGDRLRHLLQPLAAEALAQGRKLRPPPGGQGDLAPIATATPCWSRWKRSGPASATKATRAASSAAWKTASGRSPTSAPTTPPRSTEASA